MTLTAFTLEELASSNAVELLAGTLRNCLATLQAGTGKPTRSQHSESPAVAAFMNSIAQGKVRNI